MHKPLKLMLNKHYLIVLLTLISSTSFPQASNQRFIQKINSSSGLSHNIVFDIVQDGHGFIWIATQDGLNRYDGHDFKVYRFSPDDSASISGNYIKNLHIDKKGNLWATTRYGLNYYNAEYDKFIRYNLPDNKELDITHISASHDDRLWLSNYAGSFHLFNPKNKTFENYYSNSLIGVNDYIMTIHEDQYGLVWIGTGSSGLYVLKYEDNILQPDSLLNEVLIDFSDYHAEVIYEDINSNIWIGTRNGLIMYSRSLQTIQHIKKSNIKSGLGDNTILDIHQDHEGNILIGTEQSGVYILSQSQLKANNPENFTFKRIVAGPEHHNLSYRSVQCIFEDRDYNIWFGTFGNGINMIPQKQPKFKILKHNANNPNSLSFDKAWGLCNDTEGNVWIGTDGMGINKLNIRTGKISKFNSTNSKLSDDAVLCALKDSDNHLWFGTYSGGLNRYNYNLNQFEQIPVINNGRNIKDIRCLFESKDGLIWIGTNGDGLIKLNPNNLISEVIDIQLNNIVAADIRAITEDKNGGLWLGTYGAGLFYFNPKNNLIKHYAFDRIKENTLKCNIIYTLYYDNSQNKLWIGGTQSGGLNALDLNDFTFSTYNEKDGLTNNTIHSITGDNHKRLWIATNNGISSYSLIDSKFSNYNSLDGVQSKEFSDGAVLFNTVNNTIYFGGSEGLNYFYPDDFIQDTSKSKVLFTSLTIANEEHSNKRKYSKNKLHKTVPYLNEVELDHTQSNFTIGFTALNFSNPQKIFYQYMLIGATNNWVNIKDQRSISFRNLKAGEYQLRVRASNEDGIWNNVHYASLDIRIKPAPWYSWWAYTIYLFVFTTFVYWLYRYNLKEAKIRHNLALEKRMRAQESDLHEERIKFFTNISHELRTPLMLLLSPLDELLSKESVHTTLGKTYNTMYRSGTKLLQLINTLLEFRKAETGKQKLNIVEQNIVPHVEEHCIAFKALAARKNINITFSSTQHSIFLNYDPEKLEMILNNLLSNAIKNSVKSNKIDVCLSKKNKSEKYKQGAVQLKVADQGIGIPKDQLNKIFDRFYQVKSTTAESGTGIGLALTKRLVELHDGEIRVDSTEGKGTTFRIILPFIENNKEKTNASSSGISLESVQNYVSEESISENTSLIIKKISALSEEKKKILIIEDNGDIREYLFDLLEKFFIVIEAEDGEEGLAKAREEAPVLILSDVMMPKINGVELCKKLKSEIQTSHIPIILITANLAHQAHIDGLEGGADAYIIKPFKPDILITRIYNLLHSREKLHNYYLRKFQGEIAFENEKTLSADEAFLFKVKKIINDEMQHPEFSIKRIHEELGLSRTVFYNKIKSLTNMSPIELIRQLRLNRAANLLTSNGNKVYEVMIAVGFNDEKHFRQLFKNQYGVTPSEYIRQVSS